MEIMSVVHHPAELDVIEAPPVRGDDASARLEPDPPNACLPLACQHHTPCSQHSVPILIKAPAL